MFLTDWHQWLIKLAVEPRIITALVAAVVVVTMSILAAKKKPITTFWHCVTVALIAGAFGLHVGLKAVGWVVLLLLFAGLSSLNGLMLSVAQHKGIRAVLCGIAAALTVSAGCLVAAKRFTSGDLLTYFLGGGADKINWLAGVYLLFGVAISLAWAAVMNFVWKRKAEAQPSG